MTDITVISIAKHVARARPDSVREASGRAKRRIRRAAGKTSLSLKARAQILADEMVDEMESKSHDYWSTADYVELAALMQVGGIL